VGFLSIMRGRRGLRVRRRREEVKVVGDGVVYIKVNEDASKRQHDMENAF
jgi:hypothetical protein